MHQIASLGSKARSVVELPADFLVRLHGVKEKFAAALQTSVNYVCCVTQNLVFHFTLRYYSRVKNTGSKNLSVFTINNLIDTHGVRREYIHYKCAFFL